MCKHQQRLLNNTIRVFFKRLLNLGYREELLEVGRKKTQIRKILKYNNTVVFDCNKSEMDSAIAFWTEWLNGNTDRADDDQA